MPKKIILFTFLILFHSVGLCQNGHNCKVLNELLKTKRAQEVFDFQKYSELPIVFIDPSGSFRNCNLGDHDGRKVLISSDSAKASEKNHSNMLITNFVASKNKYKIAIFYKIKNALFEAEFRKARGTLTLIKFQGGFF
jgi:hypothetical protein